MKWTNCSAIALLLFAAIAPTFAGDDKAPQRKHWFVSGQVQGVGFRAFTYESATDLKLKGWVRNLSDGRVEIVAEGDAATMARLLEKVKKGPQFGRVDAVKDGAVDLKEKLGDNFQIRDSAPPPKEEKNEDGR